MMEEKIAYYTIEIAHAKINKAAGFVCFAIVTGINLPVNLKTGDFLQKEISTCSTILFLKINETL
jgi:hypothetical protein